MAASRPKPMSEQELASLCDGQISDAKEYDKKGLKGERDKAIEFLNGEVDVKAETGKSSITSNDLSDVMGWIMPGLLRVFLASDRVVIYEPVKQEMVDVQEVNPQTGQPVMVKKDVSSDRADQATDYVNHVFLNDCGGYNILHSAMYDGLALANGVIKHWWDPAPDYTTESFSGLADADFNKLVASDEVEEVLEHTPYPAPGGLGGRASLPGSVPSAGVGPEVVPDDPVAPEATADPDRGIEGPPPRRDYAAPEQTLDGVTSHRPEHIADPELPDDERVKVDGVAGPALAPGMPVEPGVPMLHDCKIKRRTNNGKLRVMAMPPEEFLLHSSTKKLDEETLACGHFYQETRSNLIKCGYDPEIVNDLPSAGGVESPEALSRNESTLAGSQTGGATKDRSTEMVDVYEWYPLVDFDGDGVAERRRVIMGGLPSKRTILVNEDWGDDLPFTDLVPDPIPHRWRGRSLFDEVKDVQRFKTALLRQTLDNLYMTNNPMTQVIEGQVVNMDALVDRTFGGNVFVKSAGAISPLEVPFTAKESFAMLEYADQLIEKRTGVSRSTMALDLDALQNQTATATNAAQAAAATKVETYARNVAEGGLKRLFRCLLKLIVKHQDKPRTIRLRGTWVEMDPRAWDADMDVAINTGLGSGSRERDLAVLQAIKAAQLEVFQIMGPMNPLVGLDKYQNTLAKMVEAGGLKNPELFFNEITPEIMQQLQQQAAQPQPDPKAQAMMAKVQMEGQKAQADMQLAQAKAQADVQMRQQEAAIKAQSERERAGLDLQLARDKAAAEMQLQRERSLAEIEIMREKAAQEYALKSKELELEGELKVMQMRMQATMAQATNIPEAAPQ
jgi:hypothetical protein